MTIKREELDRRKVDFSEVTTGQLLYSSACEHCLETPAAGANPPPLWKTSSTASANRGHNQPKSAAPGTEYPAHTTAAPESRTHLTCNTDPP